VAEAVQRPTARFVPVKTDEQLDLQALHRVRSRLVSERTAVIKQVRGFLLERGYNSSGRECASFASNCPTSWPSERTFSHRA
jgi:transposase